MLRDMADMLSRLLRAAEWGALVALCASCGGESESDDGAGGSGGSGGATSGGSGGVVDAGSDAALPTTPYPTPLGCYGPSHDSGYYGQCCEKAACIAPINGACPPATQASQVIPGYPPGSGSCSCGDNKGPFAPNAANEGACCYLFGSISCEGRPLLVAGRARKAPLVARADWASFAPLALT